MQRRVVSERIITVELSRREGEFGVRRNMRDRSKRNVTSKVNWRCLISAGPVSRVVVLLASRNLFPHGVPNKGAQTPPCQTTFMFFRITVPKLPSDRSVSVRVLPRSGYVKRVQGSWTDWFDVCLSGPSKVYEGDVDWSHRSDQA